MLCYRSEEFKGYVVSPNVDFRPDMKSKNMELPDNYEPSDIAYPRWIPDTAPYLPFMSAGMIYSGGLFQRLNIADDSIEENGRFRLKRQVIDEWWDLEMVLEKAASMLLAGTLWPVGYQRLRMPESFGYTRAHKTRGGVRKAVQLSKEAFQVLAGYMAFAVANKDGQEDGQMPR